MYVGYFYWDPPREMFSFSLPLLHRPIVWYGFFFAFGFLLGYQILLLLLRRYHQSLMASDADVKKMSSFFVEKVFVYCVIGTLIGARGVEILFYQNIVEYVQHPLLMIKVWEGGLASHGAVFGVLVALFLFCRRSKRYFPGLCWSRCLDFLVIPASCIAGCIRMGNFFNQEILGKITQVPWAVIFGHPFDGGLPFPRHPVQLYEAFFYFLLFTIFWRCLKSSHFVIPGKISGFFLLVTFSFRFFIEFFKEEQSCWFVHFLTMGQCLSIPFIFLGLFLLWKQPLPALGMIKRD